jgi:quinol monooxygenase YgiN
MSQLTNFAFFRARPGQTQALGSALSALVDPTRAETECLNYDLHRSIDDADVWFVYENWRSAEGLEAHMRAPHLQAFLKDTPDLVAGDIDLRQFSMITTPARPRV